VIETRKEVMDYEAILNEKLRKENTASELPTRKDGGPGEDRGLASMRDD